MENHVFLGVVFSFQSTDNSILYDLYKCILDITLLCKELEPVVLGSPPAPSSRHKIRNCTRIIVKQLRVVFPQLIDRLQLSMPWLQFPGKLASWVDSSF